MIHSFDPAAVSLCPPDPPIITPSDPVVTFTLKLVSISVAPKITISSLFTTEPLLLAFAYIDADIFIWLGFSLADLIAFRSKH